MGWLRNLILKTSWLTADLFTYLRLFIFAPLVIYFSATENYQAAFIYFMIGLITDALDGYTARLKNQAGEGGVVLMLAQIKFSFLFLLSFLV